MASGRNSRSFEKNDCIRMGDHLMTASLVEV